MVEKAWIYYELTQAVVAAGGCFSRSIIFFLIKKNPNFTQCGNVSG
jgi:hypothetical protein